MKKTTLLSCAYLPLMIFLPLGARAEKAAVLPASGVNVHEGYLEAAQEIFRGHLQALGRYEVLVVRGAPAKQAPTAEEAAGQARSLGADLALAIQLNRLGNTARVTLTAYDVKTGQVAYSDGLSAATPDDVDPVLARLAKGLATGKPARDTAELDTLTEKESDVPLKRQATHVRGVTLGVIAPQNTPVGHALLLPGATFFWLYDNRSFWADISVGFYAQDSHSDFSLGLGCYYPFGREDFTPYLGGGLKWSVVDFGGRSGSGLTFFGSAGMMLGRLSSVQIRGEMGYFADSFGTRDFEGVKTQWAHGPMLSVGIGL